MKKTITQLEQEKIEIDKQIAILKKQEANKRETLIIPELKIEVEINLHTEMNKVSKMVIPTGWRLLELGELIFIYNNYQDKFEWGVDKFFDEITKQPIKDCKYPYWNAWLLGLNDVLQSNLYGNYRGLYCDDAVRGVRFCRDIKVKHDILPYPKG